MNHYDAVVVVERLADSFLALLHHNERLSIPLCHLVMVRANGTPPSPQTASEKARSDQIRHPAIVASFLRLNQYDVALYKAANRKLDERIRQISPVRYRWLRTWLDQAQSRADACVAEWLGQKSETGEGRVERKLQRFCLPKEVEDCIFERICTNMSEPQRESPDDVPIARSTPPLRDNTEGRMKDYSNCLLWGEGGFYQAIGQAL